MVVNEIFLARLEAAGRVDSTDGPETFLNVTKVKTADGSISVFIKMSEGAEPEGPPVELEAVGARLKVYAYELSATEVKPGTELGSARIIKRRIPLAGKWEEEPVKTSNPHNYDDIGPDDTIELSYDATIKGPFDDREDTLTM